VSERRRRPRPLRRLAGGAAAIVLCTTVAVAALAIGAVSTIAADIALGGKPIASTFLSVPRPGSAETILVIGDDHSGPIVNGVRLLHADTFMLVRMDPAQGQTSIMSIPRDLLVNFTWKGVPYTNQKFNSAYSIGGAKLVIQVARKTLPQLSINHVIDVNFSAFIGVVRAIGCVYVDVDHRYLNNTDSSYQPINLEPGYQRLCAAPALSYVRYRHDDSDFVRVARQQDFVRQAKEQLGLFDLITKFDQIAGAFGRAIHTDIRGSKEINQLLALVAFSQSRPVRQVSFQYTDAAVPINGEDYVTSTAQLIAASESQFAHAQRPAALAAAATSAAAPRHGHDHRRHRARASARIAAPDMTALSTDVRPQALMLEPNLGFALYLPRHQTTTAVPSDFRDYSIRDEQGRRFYGYRIDWYLQTAGEYYGIEGTNWTDPPLFANPNATVTIGGRSYMFVDDGSHIHDIGWRAGHAVYWVANTLNEALTNAQMLALARSARPLTVR
jgi:polyisoprenyl-teichoic acid--peptidoglycan teichoic acid transferase